MQLTNSVLYDHYNRRLLAHAACVAAQGKAKDKALSTAFVTFKDTFTTTIAATSMMHHDLRHWSTREAPAPRVMHPCLIAW